MERDPMIVFRTVVKGQNKKGGDRIQLYLSAEKAGEMAQFLQAFAQNPRGAKLDLHISKKINSETGSSFDSAIAFVKPVSEGPAARAAAPRTVTPKYTQEEINKTIEGFKAKTVSA